MDRLPEISLLKTHRDAYKEFLVLVPSQPINNNKRNHGPGVHLR
jgi:hypothetical protein